MLKFGFEKEFFIFNEDNNLVTVPDFLRSYADDSGLLVEARGEPSTNITQAVFNLKAKVFDLEHLTRTKNFCLSDFPIQKVSRELRIQARRQFSKGTIEYQNFYGFQHHRNNRSEHYAGLHFSITNESEFSYTTRGSDGVESRAKFTYNKNFDWPRIFIALDNIYKSTIRATKRNPGFYELKSNGRVEYRSLPSDVNLENLIYNLREILNV